MRMTVEIDEELLGEAVALADPGMDRSEMLQECVKAFIRQQAAKRLAALGGNNPRMERVPRRRGKTGSQ